VLTGDYLAELTMAILLKDMFKDAGRGYARTFLSQMEIEKKAEIVKDTLFDAIGGQDRFAVTDVQLIRSDKPDPPTNDEAFAYLRFTVMDHDAKKVAHLSSAIVELALANIPGFALTAPPSKGTQAVVHWPSLVHSKYIRQTVSLPEGEITVESVSGGEKTAEIKPSVPDIPDVPQGPTVRVPLGRAFATRSGDKGGNANLGVWAKTPSAYAFLRISMPFLSGRSNKSAWICRRRRLCSGGGKNGESCSMCWKNAVPRTVFPGMAQPWVRFPLPRPA
jgi:hypothetical protein